MSGAADTVLAGLQLLKNSLGIAALVILGAEFVPAVSGTVVPPGSSVRVQASVQLCRHRPVPGAVCLSDGGGPVHGGGHSTVLFADNGRCRVDDNDERRVKCGS